MVDGASRETAGCQNRSYPHTVTNPPNPAVTINIKVKEIYIHLKKITNINK